MRRPLAALVAALGLVAPGCGLGGEDDGGDAGKTLTIYVSVPLHGERAAEGRAIVNGARLALARADGRVGELRIEATYLDDTAGGPKWSPVASAANAREAAEDATTIGYIGELDSGATRTSLPITNQAEIVQISPGSTAVDLTRLPPVGEAEPERYRPSDMRNFARIVPADDVQAHAAAELAARLGAQRALIVSEDSDFGNILAEEFGQRASELGIELTSPRVNPGVNAEPLRADVLYFGGTPENFRSKTGAALAANPARAVIASDAMLSPPLAPFRAARLAEPLYITSPYVEPFRTRAIEEQRFPQLYRERFGTQPPPAAAYGYEAMSLLLDAIERAGSDGDSRKAVIDEVLATQDRDSVIGSYSIDGNGDTTLEAITVYKVAGGHLSFDREVGGEPRPQG